MNYMTICAGGSSLKSLLAIVQNSLKKRLLTTSTDVSTKTLHITFTSLVDFLPQIFSRKTKFCWSLSFKSVCHLVLVWLLDLALQKVPTESLSKLILL